MHQCIECGIPFAIPHAGFLVSKQRSHHQIEKSFFPYQDEDELLDILLQKHEWQDSSVTLGLTKTAEQPLFMLSYSEMLGRVKNKDIVNIINTGELSAFIQPIYELKNNQLFAFESLLRTNSQTPIPPGRLFEVAEQTGMLSKLDKRAREAAIRTRATHIKTGIKSFINFLPSTIYNPEYCLKHTFELVEKYNINPKDLVFEVVETEKIVDLDHLKKVFLEYKKQGMKVALDDLGAGFSTVEVLESLRPDYVKIDRGYIDHCDSDLEKQRFLQNVLDIAKALRIHVLAEGIEREEELEYCRDIGVDLAQGYLLGRPQPADVYVDIQT